MQQINKSENEEGGKMLFYSTVYLLLDIYCLIFGACKLKWMG